MAHWIAHQGHSRRQGQMLVQTSSPPHHCSTGSTKSLPPGVLQPEPAPAPTGGPTTNSYIAQPGNAYTSAGHGHRWTPQPRLVYWSPGNYCTLRQCPVPVDTPHVAPPGYTYQHQPPHFPHPCRRLYPHTRTRHATDAAAFHTCGSASNPPSQRLLQTDAADPHPTHRRYLGVRSTAAPPTATAFQSGPVYQPHPYHPSITDETGLCSKDTQCINDRFVADIGGQDLSRRFKGVVNHKTVTSLDRTNDPVIFDEHFRTEFAGRSSWTLPADQPGLGGHLPCLSKTNEPPFGSSSSYDFSRTTSSPKRLTNKTPPLPYQPST